MKKVRLGLIGAGGWGAMHARTYACTPQADLQAVADLDPERARTLAEQYGARVFRQTRPGYGPAFIEGIMACKGEFIICLDAECFHPKAFLRSMISASKDVDIIIESR